jgi:bacterioferritin (cytochrome b1)
MTDERMNVEEQIARLNAALRLQLRSATQYTLTAGSLTGIEHQAIAEKLGSFALAELDDGRRLVEKVAALGGEPTADAAPARFSADPHAAIEWLIESETEALQALQDAIEPTGREAASEAVEHRLEHIIMRKQEQVDALIRASGGPNSR